MKRTWLNFLIDTVIALAALGLVWTGFLMQWVLPKGSPREGLSLWGFDRHDWGGIHLWFSYAVIVLVVVHIALHWQWIATMVCRLIPRWKGGAPSAGRRNLTGALLVLLCVGLIAGSLYFASTLTVQDDSSRGGEGWGGGWRGGRALVE